MRSFKRALPSLIQNPTKVSRMESQTTTNTTTDIGDNILIVRDSILESMKFVEAKHAGLIALNSGLIFGVFSIYKELTKQSHWSLLLILSFFAISVLLSLIAFYPLSKFRKQAGVNNNTASNILYAEELAKLDKEQFKNVFLQQPNRIQEDLISWTHNTARVSARKYKLFRNAVRLCITGLTFALIAGACHIICQLITNL